MRAKLSVTCLRSIASSRGPQFSVGETATLVVCSFRFFDRIVLLHDTYRSR
jgi:hypothetical protein